MAKEKTNGTTENQNPENQNPENQNPENQNPENHGGLSEADKKMLEALMERVEKQDKVIAEQNKKLAKFEKPAEEETVERKSPIREPEKLYEIQIPMLHGDEAAFPIGVNGEIIQVVPGKWVTMKGKFVNALQNALDQSMSSITFMEREAGMKNLDK